MLINNRIKNFYHMLFLLFCSFLIFSCSAESGRSDFVFNFEDFDDPEANFSGNVFYIRENALGLNNGSDWTNAFPTIPDSLQRNAMYYIADGSYGEYDFDDPEDGNKYIIIKKATIEKHGTDTGWIDSYGDGQAEFRKTIRFSTDYWVWDGAQGTEKEVGSYGFLIEPGPGTENDTHSRILSMQERTNIFIKYTEFWNWGEANASNQTAIYCLNGRNIAIQNNFMYDHVATILIGNCDLLLIENNYFYNNWSGSDFHGEHISTREDTRVVCRFNIFEESTGSGIIHVVTGESSGWLIYGNIFVNGNTGRPSVSAGGSHAFSNIYVFNNTFVNVVHAGFHGSNGSNNDVFNNLYYNCELAYIATALHSYNWYYNCGDNWEEGEENAQVGTGDPFIDINNFNFQLTGATNPGRSVEQGLVEQGFNTDMNGTIRGVDNNLDRGAIELIN